MSVDGARQQYLRELKGYWMYAFESGVPLGMPGL
jgi:hypothetical protein